MEFWRPGSNRPTQSERHHHDSIVADTRALAKTRASQSLLDRGDAGGAQETGVAPVFNPNIRLSLSQQRRLLPVYASRDEILFAVEHFSTVILIGETGSGKTTQIPQYLHEAGWTSDGFTVVCTQPRRVAASTVAARVADEMGTQLGQEVGYCVQFDDNTDPTKTRIKYATDGLILREIMMDPLLLRYSVVMVDEAHERGINTDLLLGLLHFIQRKRRDLRVIIASATLDALKFKSFFEYDIERKQSIPTDVAAILEQDSSTTFQTKRRRRTRWDNPDYSVSQTLHSNTELTAAKAGSTKNTEKGTGEISMSLPPSSIQDPDPQIGSVAMVNILGRQFPVDIEYKNDPVSDYVVAAVETALAVHQNEAPGDILIFLPGAEEIDDAIEMLTEHAPHPATSADDHRNHSGPGMLFFPLYAALSYDRQLAAVLPSPRVDALGQPIRKCIVATNIAETSITLEGVVYVIDCGLVKMPMFNAAAGIESLLVQPISQAAAQQRAGRAGRVRPGKCFRLYTEEMFQKLQHSTPPEIVRTQITSAVLLMKALGIRSLAKFHYLDSPPVDSMMRALDILFALGALDQDANLTEPWGRYMAEFPADPPIAAMLMRSLFFGCSEEALTVAAMLTVKDVFIRSTSGRKRLEKSLPEYAVFEGDHITLFNIYNGFIDSEMSREWCGENGFHFSVLKRAVQVRKQLRRCLQRILDDARAHTQKGQDDSAIKDEDISTVAPRLATYQHFAQCSISSTEDESLVRKCITAGFFMNAARLGHGGLYSTVKDAHAIQLSPQSVLSKFGAVAEWILFHEAVQTSKTTVQARDAIVISPAWLLELAPDFFQSKRLGANTVWENQSVGDMSAYNKYMSSQALELSAADRTSATDARVTSLKTHNDTDIATVRFRPKSERDTDPNVARKSSSNTETVLTRRKPGARLPGGGRSDWRSASGGIASVLQHLVDDE